MSKEFLHGWYIVAALQKLRGKTVTEGVAGGPLGLAYGPIEYGERRASWSPLPDLPGWPDWSVQAR